MIRNSTTYIIFFLFESLCSAVDIKNTFVRYNVTIILRSAKFLTGLSYTLKLKNNIVCIGNKYVNQFFVFARYQIKIYRITILIR